MADVKADALLSEVNSMLAEIEQEKKRKKAKAEERRVRCRPTVLGARGARTAHL